VLQGFGIPGGTLSALPPGQRPHLLDAHGVQRLADAGQFEVGFLQFLDQAQAQQMFLPIARRSTRPVRRRQHALADIEMHRAARHAAGLFEFGDGHSA
jgi:hypothetical protein